MDDLIEKQGVKRTALMWAACDGDTVAVRDLIRNGAAVDAVTNTGLTAIMFAAHNGHTETVEELIRCGASLEHTDNKGKTALMFAQNSHRIQTAKLIKERMGQYQAASPIINTKDMAKSKLHEEEADIRNLAKATLFSAVMIGRTDIMNQIFSCHKDYVHATDSDGKTLLMLAAEEGHTHIIQELLDSHGADVEAIDSTGRSVLDYAAQGKNSSEIIELLQKFLREHTAPTIDEEESVTECQICLCSKPNIAFIPCGHGTCNSCFDDLMRSEEHKCHVCRQPIEKTLKLYL